MTRMVLGFRWSGVSANMSNKELGKELARLEKRYGPRGEPRRMPDALRHLQRQAAGRAYTRGIAPNG